MTSQTTLGERFLSVFQGDIRNNITTFCRSMWDLDSDVLIFMARKAACFYDCLHELGLAGVRGVALSDRILDMDLSFLKGKRVTLVDDCIFTGTTLFRARNAVIGAECKSLNTLTLAINKDSFRPELLPDGDDWDDLRILRPVFGLSNSDCVRQCFDMVRAISIVPRPYDVDFPHSRTVKMKGSDFDTLLKLPGWQAYEASSDFQRSHGVRAFSMLPMRHVLEQFCDEYGGEVGSLPTAKIRVYARRTSSSYSVRFVPIVVLPAAEHEQVNRALGGSSRQVDRQLEACGFISPTSRYRLLTFIFAHRFLKRFSDQAAQAASLQVSTDLRSDLMEMSFGTGMWRQYLANWADNASVQLPTPVSGDVQSHTSSFGSWPVAVADDQALASNAVDPFTWLYKERELPTREVVKENGLGAECSQSSKHKNRLLEGFTPSFLSNRLQNPTIDMASCMSVMLDRLVDLGIAVPTLVIRNGYCCRAYRHGEDAVLGEAQERMILQALSAYMEARNTETVGALELTKFLVLFIQISIRSHLLDRFNAVPNTTANCRIVSIKGHLHGPVPTVYHATELAESSGRLGAPFIAGTDAHPFGLVNDWLKKRWLSRESSTNPRLNRYRIASMPELSLGRRADAQARQIGRCLGTAAKVLDVSNDLVLLSTCAECDHQIRALSGEIAIFRERWGSLSDRLRQASRESRYADAHAELRTFGDVFLAVNSGARKYEWYANGEFDKLVERVARTLPTIDKNEADQWVQLWPEARPLGEDSRTFEGKHIYDSGRWLFSLNVAMRLIDYWLVLMAHRHGQVAVDEVDDAASDVKAWIGKTQAAFGSTKQASFMKRLNDIAVNIDQRDVEDARTWCEEAGSLLKLFAQKNSTLLLDEARAVANAYGSITGLQSYPYAVFFDVQPTGKKPGLVLQRAFEEALRSTKVEAYQYLADGHNPWAAGRWILLSGNRLATSAVELCHQVAARLVEKGVRFRAAVIGQLSADDSVRVFSNSPELAFGFFLRRLAQLQKHLLSPGYDDSIGFANEATTGSANEADKYSGIAAKDCKVYPHTTVVLDDPDLPKKEFVVSAGYVLTSGKAASDRVAASGPMPTPKPKLKVLLCTATDKEDDVLTEIVADRGYRNEPVTRKHGTYRYLGEIGDASVYWVRSGMGGMGPDGSSLTIIDAIGELRPHYVISCGLAFGRDSTKQQIGDVLVSQWIRSYEPGKQQPGKFIPRGSRVPANPQLLQAARSARIDMRDLRVTVGGILSGEKLVDDPDFKKRIWEIDPEAVGGEMEGAGIVDACHRRSAPWIVIKAICDWGEHKDSEAQPLAAANAIRFALSLIEGRLLPRG